MNLLLHYVIGSVVELFAMWLFTNDAPDLGFAAFPIRVMLMLVGLLFYIIGTTEYIEGRRVERSKKLTDAQLRRKERAEKYGGME